MLVNYLRCINYEPVPEITILYFDPDKCKAELLDPLIVPGKYDPEERIVYICEPLVEDIVSELKDKFSKSYSELYFTYREIVRLHEHIHACIHQMLGACWEYEPYVDEPVTEFLCYCVIKHVAECEENLPNLFLEVFEKIDRIRPYDMWKDVLDIMVNGVRTEEICERTNWDLRLIFRVFIDALSAHPKNFNDLRCILEKYDRWYALCPMEII